MNTVPKRLPDPTKMAPFNPEATCPKCGHPEVDAKYRVFVQILTNTKKEWIRRECQRCRYLWDEACLESSTPDRAWAEDDEDWDVDQA